MCGIVGIAGVMPVNQSIYDALTVLQHRGQDAAGIITIDANNCFRLRKANGLVSDVFEARHMQRLQGNMGIGHVRYPTAGSSSASEAQPFYVNSPYGITLAHNGNLTNSYELRNELEQSGSIFHTTTDSEVIAYIIVQERLRTPSIEEAVYEAMGRIEGAYSLVISSPTKLIAARDPHGFRPLCMGQTQDGKTVFASETCALDAIGAEYVRDVRPGEVITVSYDGIKADTRRCNSAPKSLCVFEFVYFARPDSSIDGAAVSLARQKAGAFLAAEHPVEADVVIGVPDSGLDAALGYAKASGLPYGIGFTKNKYIGRTFISPTQEQREVGVNIKLNPIRSLVEGKRIVLIDDSIVRGTTCRGIIDLLRKAGAKEIHMRVSAPPFVAPCYYGTDIDDAENLIANHHTVEEIAQIIGVDSLGYLSVEHLLQIADGCNGFCTACFGGAYPTAIPSRGDKDRFERKLQQKIKTKEVKL